MCVCVAALEDEQVFIRHGRESRDNAKHPEDQAVHFIWGGGEEAVRGGGGGHEWVGEEEEGEGAETLDCLAAVAKQSTLRAPASPERLAVFSSHCGA